MPTKRPRHRRPQHHGVVGSMLTLLKLQIIVCFTEAAFVPSTQTRLHRRSSQFLAASGRRTSSRNGNRNCISKRGRNLERGRKSSRLHGICEWRDEMFDFSNADDTNPFRLESDGPRREICILPFPFDEVLLQGERKELNLYEDRFLKLFEDCMNNHCGVVGMGLLAESGIIQTVPLCEIESFSRMEGYGIFVTIRVVGRASLLHLTQQEPYIKAVCNEISDSISPNLDLPNLVAGNIENFMVTLSSIEYKLEEAALLDAAMEDAMDAVSDDEMRQRIIHARMDNQFYYDKAKIDVEYKDSYEMSSDDEDEDDDPDRAARFRGAFEVALSTDTQGYMVVASPEETERSAQVLTAISWAAFCTDDPVENSTYRIQALDCDDLFDRLKLASFMLREKKAELQAKLALNRIKYQSDDIQGE